MYNNLIEYNQDHELNKYYNTFEAVLGEPFLTSEVIGIYIKQTALYYILPNIH